MSRIATPLAVSDGQRQILESLAQSRVAAHRVVQRARVLLSAADGVSNSEISEVAGVSRPTVLAWRAQFTQDGLTGFGEVATGRGQKPSISDEKVAEIVELTQHLKPKDATHWSCRSMGKHAGVSPATVRRIWSARGLKPHLVKTFKISGDPRFEEKLIDVVGLYLNPPKQAVVLCMDEKSQIQALDRTQPSLPLKPGRAATMTHDYQRNAHHHPVRRAGCAHRHGDRPLPASAPQHQVPEILARHRPCSAQGPGSAHDPRSLRHPQA